MDLKISAALTSVQVVIVMKRVLLSDNMGEGPNRHQRATTGNIYCNDDYGEEHVVAYDDGFTAVRCLVNGGQVDCAVIDNAPAQSSSRTRRARHPRAQHANETMLSVNKRATALCFDYQRRPSKSLTADGTVQEHN